MKTQRGVYIFLALSTCLSGLKEPDKYLGKEAKHIYFQLNGELELGHISFFCPKVLNLESDFKNNPPQARFSPSSWHLNIKFSQQSGTTENSFWYSNDHTVRKVIFELMQSKTFKKFSIRVKREKEKLRKE